MPPDVAWFVMRGGSLEKAIDLGLSKELFDQTAALFDSFDSLKVATLEILVWSPALHISHFRRTSLRQKLKKKSTDPRLRRRVCRASISRSAKSAICGRRETQARNATS
jgi:hypothetical protein